MTIYSATTRLARAEPARANLGAVFTKRWVVEFILDLAGYDPATDLTSRTAIEPAVGQGAFLVPMVDRLLRSARANGVDIATTETAISGFDIDPESVEAARSNVTDTLLSGGVDGATATRLARAWVREADFLNVAPDLPRAYWILGNPPYVRVENIDREDMSTYRSTWSTMSGRADLYVGFLQAGLSLLEPQGRMAVICADRWMRNQYGAGLRAMVEDGFAMDACVVMHQVDAFEDTVSAYPAITLIRNGDQGPAMVCDAAGTLAPASTSRLTSVWQRGPAPVADDRDFNLSWTTGWFRGTGSWPDAHPTRLAEITALEARLPLLEETGAKVSVGVATGADDIYITERAASTEPGRLLKTVGAKEVSTGAIEWAGRYLVNPWDDDGLIPLSDAPGMAAYLRHHAPRLKQRYVAAKSPKTWWRTIDRIHPAVTERPKLLIPDLKNTIFPVYDEGNYYPGHSLYYLTSDTWDLEVLGGLLMSRVASGFVEAYSVRMANGYLRVSAQYLRRVRVPRPEDIDPDLRDRLREAFRARDQLAADTHARTAYGLE